jgi:hypothetical protein
MPRLTLCYTIALAAAPMTTFAAGSPQCTPLGSVECALRTAGVRDPAAMTETLLRAELRTVTDVAELDVAEAAELFEELRAALVPLGDRSRLRKVAPGGVWGGVHGASAAIFEPRTHLHDEAPEETLCDKSGAGHERPPGLGRWDWERGPGAQHRQLQSGGGFSIEVAAIAFTGLIGMVGYAVQARSQKKASEAQASLLREAAERDKAEAKAGKQLERVQLQTAEWVRPFSVDSCFLVHGWIAIARECKLLGYLRLHSIEYVPQPSTPYIDLRVGTNPAWFAAMGRAPYTQLPPEDLALLAADPALRSRYCELAAAMLLPPLRRLNLLIATKMHLNESLAPARLDPVLPGTGRDWTSLVGSLTFLLYQLQEYAGQFESLAGRWEEERLDLLQPNTPGLHVMLMFFSVEQIKDVGAKELQLLGASSGSRTTAGSLNYMKGGAGLAGGDGKEAET